MDLDLWNCFGRKKNPSYIRGNTVRVQMTVFNIVIPNLMCTFTFQRLFFPRTAKNFCFSNVKLFTSANGKQYFTMVPSFQQYVSNFFHACQSAIALYSKVHKNQFYKHVKQTDTLLRVYPFTCMCVSAHPLCSRY